MIKDAKRLLHLFLLLDRRETCAGKKEHVYIVFKIREKEREKGRGGNKKRDRERGS